MTQTKLECWQKYEAAVLFKVCWSNVSNVCLQRQPFIRMMNMPGQEYRIPR